MNKIVQELQDSIDTKKKLLTTHIEIIQNIADVIIKAFKNNNCVYLMGNGGSAADAQHLAGEFVGRFKLDRRPLPAVAFTTDSSVITAIGNDFGYDLIFSRQVEALVKAGDVIMAFTTSGNSANILNAVKSAKGLMATSVGFTGDDGGILKDEVDICVRIPSSNTARIQECHITIGHILCSLVEEELFGAKTK